MAPTFAIASDGVNEFAGALLRTAVLGLASRPTGDFLRWPPALTLRGGWLCQRAGGPRRRYCAAILLHCASASCLSEAIGIFAAAVRQACFALLSAVFTFALLVVI